MILTAQINGEEYEMASDYSISQQAGSVSRSTCQVLVGDGQDYPRVFEACTIYSGETPIFSGDITSVESPAFATGKEVIRVKLNVDSLESRAKRRRISISRTETYTHEIIQEIFDDYISQEGIALGAISTTDRLFKDWNASFYSAFDALNELADDAGAQWYISPDKKFYFVLKTDIETITAPERISGLRLTESAGDIRTMQTVVGASEETSNQTQSVYWANDQYNVTLNYQVSEIIGITIEGVPASFGVIGVDEDDTSKTFLYQYAGQIINLNDNAVTKPTTGDLVVITYKGFYDIIIINTNEGLKTEIASISGSSGIIENILSDETITNNTDADAKANALLDENGERVQEVNCQLPDVAGTDIGTAWTMDYPELGIAGTFVVTEKNISDYVDRFYVKLKLKNKNLSSRYGQVLKKEVKEVRPDTKVLQTITISDKIRRPTEVVEFAEPVSVFPAQDGAYAGMFYPAVNLAYPVEAV